MVSNNNSNNRNNNNNNSNNNNNNNNDDKIQYRNGNYDNITNLKFNEPSICMAVPLKKKRQGIFSWVFKRSTEEV